MGLKESSRSSLAVRGEEQKIKQTRQLYIYHLVLRAPSRRRSTDNNKRTSPRISHLLVWESNSWSRTHGERLLHTDVIGMNPSRCHVMSQRRFLGKQIGYTQTPQPTGGTSLNRWGSPWPGQGSLPDSIRYCEVWCTYMYYTCSGNIKIYIRFTKHPNIPSSTHQVLGHTSLGYYCYCL